MGHLEAAHLEYFLPDGRPLLGDVSFRVGEGAVMALVGPKGAGKTSLLRLLAGELTPHGGSVTVSGGLGVMRQFVGSVRDDSTVRDLLVSVATPRVREAARAVDRAEHAIMTVDDEAAQLAYAQALADWAEARGYEAETLWDMRTIAACGRRCGAAPPRSRSSTSAATSSTSPASGGWRAGSRSPAGPCCSCRTAASSSRGPPSASSPWTRAPPAPTPGCTAAASP